MSDIVLHDALRNLVEISVGPVGRDFFKHRFAGPGGEVVIN